MTAFERSREVRVTCSVGGAIALSGEGRGAGYVDPTGRVAPGELSDEQRGRILLGGPSGGVRTRLGRLRLRPPQAEEHRQTPGALAERGDSEYKADLHVAVAGEGEPVLLVHDWPQHWYAWREVIPRLAERHQVIALDIRGFGGR